MHSQTNPPRESKVSPTQSGFVIGNIKCLSPRCKSTRYDRILSATAVRLSLRALPDYSTRSCFRITLCTLHLLSRLHSSFELPRFVPDSGAAPASFFVVVQMTCLDLLCMSNYFAPITSTARNRPSKIQNCGSYTRLFSCAYQRICINF